MSNAKSRLPDFEFMGVIKLLQMCLGRGMMKKNGKGCLKMNQQHLEELTQNYSVVCITVFCVS